MHGHMNVKFRELHSNFTLKMDSNGHDSVASPNSLWHSTGPHSS